MNFHRILDTLEKTYGPSVPNTPADPLEMILLENSAYLVGDDQRERAFNALRDRIGLTPADILSASPEDLFSVAEMGGPMPELRVKKLCDIATTAMAEFDGDLSKVLQLPFAQARKALKNFRESVTPVRIKYFYSVEPTRFRPSNRTGYGR